MYSTLGSDAMGDALGFPKIAGFFRKYLKDNEAAIKKQGGDLLGFQLWLMSQATDQEKVMMAAGDTNRAYYLKLMEERTGKMSDRTAQAYRAVGAASRGAFVDEGAEGAIRRIVSELERAKDLLGAALDWAGATEGMNAFAATLKGTLTDLERIGSIIDAIWNLEDSGLDAWLRLPDEWRGQRVRHPRSQDTRPLCGTHAAAGPRC